VALDTETGTDVTLDAALAATEREADAALKQAVQVTRELRAVVAGARTGQLRDLRKALAAAAASTSALAERARALQDGLDLDEQEYLSSGAYAKELLAEAAARGVQMFEEEDRLLCYPSLVRILPGETAVEVDRVRERRLRPSVLVGLLAHTQQRAPRFKAEAFLDSLRSAYELVVARDGKKADGVVRLADVWSVLTMLPGQRGQYSKQEFARDLYLLDQSGVTSTARSPRELRLSASTGTKNSGVLVTVARDGRRQYYWGVSFTTPDAGSVSVPDGGAVTLPDGEAVGAEHGAR
jgi:hypothetical protein